MIHHAHPRHWLAVRVWASRASRLENDPMVGMTETAVEPSGYLVVLRTAMDDLPQRMFASKADAERYARELVAETVENPFGDFHGANVIEGSPIAILGFEEGIVSDVEFIERDDLPERLPNMSPWGESINLAPRDCYGTLVVDANGEYEFIDVCGDRDGLRHRIRTGSEVRKRLAAIEAATHKPLCPPLRVGTVYIGHDGKSDGTTFEEWESLND